MIAGKLMFRGYLLLILAHLAVAAWFSVVVVTGTEEKTSSLIVVSGGHGTVRWREENRITIEGKEWYCGLGMISLGPRAQPPSPIDVVVWGRGMGDIALFELTPLWDAFDELKSPDELRFSLFPANGAVAQPSSGLSDRQQLENLIGQAQAPASLADQILRWKRQIAVDQMKLLGVSSAVDLWEPYRRQEQFATRKWRAPLSPSALRAIWDSRSKTTAVESDEAAEWPSLIEALRQKGLLVSAVRTTVFSMERPRTLGYILRLPESADKQTDSELIVAARNAEVERIPLSLNIEREDSVFDSWKKFAGTIFTPSLIGVVIGYWGFRLQQNYLRQAEAEKQFQERKIALSSKLWNFFSRTRTYRALYESGRTDLEKVIGIREALIEEGIYAILPQEEIRKLAQTCDGSHPIDGSRVEALHGLLKKHFGEFMNRDLE